MIVSGAFRWFFLSTSSPFVSFLYKSVLGGLLYEIVKQFYNRVKLTKIYNCVFSKYILNFGNTVMIFIGLHYYIYSNGLSRKQFTTVADSAKSFSSLIMLLLWISKTSLYIWLLLILKKDLMNFQKDLLITMPSTATLLKYNVFFFRKETHLFL